MPRLSQPSGPAVSGFPPARPVRLRSSGDWIRSDSRPVHAGRPALIGIKDDNNGLPRRPDGTDGGPEGAGTTLVDIEGPYRHKKHRMAPVKSNAASRGANGMRKNIPPAAASLETSCLHCVEGRAGRHHRKGRSPPVSPIFLLPKANDNEAGGTAAVGKPQDFDAVDAG